MPASSTRREALRRAVVVGGTGLGAATTFPSLLGVPAAFAQADGDQAVLAAAIRLENTAVAAYDAALRSRRLDSQTTRLVQTLRAHEQEHAQALTVALRERGGAPPAGVERGLLPAAGRLRDQRAILAFAVELETMAVAAYYDAVGKLGDAKLLQAATSIMASEGQHLAVLRQALGRRPFPEAVETGQAGAG